MASTIGKPPIKRSNYSQLLLIFLTSFLFFSCSSDNQPDSKQNESYALNEEYRAKELPTGLDTLLDSQIPLIKERMAAHEVPGLAIAVTNREKILWEAGFGVRNRKTGKPVNTETVFSVQSISKLFTSTAVMREVQKGTIDLDVPISRYLPDFTVNSRFSEHPEEKMTMRHLQHHAAGFTHEAPVGNNYNAYSPSFEAHVNSISDTWLQYPVGNQWDYSNLGIDLAGYILQKQTGIPFENYMKDSLLTPLGMSRSFVDRPDQQLCSNCAMGHDEDFEKLPEYIPMTAAGGVRVDAGDGARFVQFHLNRGKTPEGQTLIESRFIEEIYGQPVIRDDNWSKNVWAGMAVIISKDDSADTYMMRMSGGGFGYLAEMIWYPEYGIGAVVLTNAVDHPEIDYDIAANVLRQIMSEGLVNKVDDPSIPSVDEFYERELAKSPAVETEPEKEKITPYRPEWDKYLGRYRMIRSGGYQPELPADSLRGCLEIFKRNEALNISGCSSAEGDPLIEHKQGLFFHSTSGEALDFRGASPTWRNIELRKVESYQPDEKILSEEDQLYVCPPCACSAHEDGNNETFKHDEACPYCGMQLTEKTDSSEIGQVNIETGSGNFLVEGGPGHREKIITVFYHKPERFSSVSPILFVIPGSGRDGDEYRDAWIEASEKYGLLVLSPRYPEDDYGFGQYHMGGLMYDMNPYDHIQEAENTNELFLNEDTFTFKVNQNREDWIFNDFDRIFDMVVDSVGSTRKRYDIFGHSAGGQILHRFVLFTPESKADRILASNSGFYTMPVLGTKLPFGLNNTPVTLKSLKTSFEKQLVLFIGEEDNEDEMGGILLRSPTVDRQGTHRLERSEYFYRQSKALADSLDAQFNWEREVIPGVGHNFRKMSEAAARYLYRDK